VVVVAGDSLAAIGDGFWPGAHQARLRLWRSCCAVVKMLLSSGEYAVVQWQISCCPPVNMLLSSAKYAVV